MLACARQTLLKPPDRRTAPIEFEREEKESNIMADKKKTVTKKQPQAGLSGSKLLWIGVGAAVLLFVLIALFVASRSGIPFEMTGGEVNPIVVLRNENTIYYEFSYTGESPATLQRFIPRIQLYQDQVIVADVQGVSIVYNGEEIVLDDGSVPEGTDLTIAPGATFQVGVTFLGQEIGWNRIYGWRVQYTVAGEAVDGELELKDDYYIFVE